MVLFSSKKNKTTRNNKLARILAGLTSWHACESPCLVSLSLLFIPAELLGDVTVVIDAAAAPTAVQAEHLKKFPNNAYN